MIKGAWKIAKINLQNIKAVYISVAAFILAMAIQFLITMAVAAAGSDMSYSNSNPSVGGYTWLILLIAAIIIPLKNFRRMVNLGGRRGNFILGSLITYAIMAIVISWLNTMVFYTFDRFIQQSGLFDQGLLNGVMNLVEIFGWLKNGPLVVFAQQCAFLFMVAAVVHTLVSMQDKWYGWVTDVVIAAIIAVFVPIAPLRAVLVWFFNMIIFQPNALGQIAACLVIGGAVYALNLVVYARKAI